MQTVILDCCHRASKPRSDESAVRGCKLSPNDVPDYLYEHIRQEHSPIAKGFAVRDMTSHILLAACGAGEFAWEDKKGQEVHGRFTTALLALLRAVPPDQITYTNVLSKIPRIDG